MNKPRSAYFDGIKYDDLIFVCSSVVGVARMIRQPEAYVVEHLKEKGIRLELETAQVNHCGAPENYYRELVEDYELETGTYDVRNYLDADTRLPDDRYMGSIYARLIVDVAEERKKPLISVFMEVFASELPECLNDFSMAYYFMPSNQLLDEYLGGEFVKCNPLREKESGKIYFVILCLSRIMLRTKGFCFGTRASCHIL